MLPPGSYHQIHTGIDYVVRLSLGSKLLVNVLQVVKRTNIPQSP